MNQSKHNSLRFLTALFCLIVQGLAADTETGFVSIFNGKDLTGWEGKMGWWCVKEGAITSESTPEKPCQQCNYLMWRGGQPGDFDLCLEYRLTGGNSGIQFRSRELPNFDTSGYQADMEAGDQWSGCLFEHTRGGISMRGQRVVIDKNGAKQTTLIGDEKELLKKVKKNDWNSYRILARGNEITLEINGVVMCQAVDDQEGLAARKGVIAFQMHPGPPMKIQFRNIRLKVLDSPASKNPSAK